MTKAKANQQHVNRDTLRMVLLVLALLILAAVVLAGRVAVYRWFDRYPIQRITVMGELQHVDQQTLQAALAPYMVENFFTVDLEKVKETAESLTWIDYADAKKEWPNTVIVYLQERVPVANWGKSEFLSVKGEIFSAEHVQPDVNLPTFIGKPDQAVVIAERFTKMQKILREVGLSVKAIELEDRISWRAQLDNGLMLVVDDKDSMEKLKRFTRLYAMFTEQQKQQLFKVDLRYENGLAIKWKKDDGDTDAA
ncbi:MAG: FtsQ-type POTRA domain-containing protein [Pseudomonadota bacterium]|nr:FtsQ-type POTRA domain-containing protein [Pseudomonadota bacterium]